MNYIIFCFCSVLLLAQYYLFLSCSMQILFVPLLRRRGAAVPARPAHPPTDRQETHPQTAAAAVLIDYNALCDDIYPCDWVQ
jgi:hypothetical protein